MSSADPDSRAPRMSLRRRMFLAILATSLIPLLLAGAIAHHVGRQNLRDAAIDKLVGIRDARAEHVRDAYRIIEAQLLELAGSCTVRDGLAQLTPALRQLPEEAGGDAAAFRASLRTAYEGAFAERYARETGEAPDLDGLVPVEPYQVLAQVLYIASNPADVGRKQELDRPAGDRSSYGAAHAVHHPILRSFLERFGYYDIFLVDPDGVVVYSVAKEIDFATDLRNGPHRDSELAQAALTAVDTSRPGTAFLTDYHAYLPSYEAPASFIAAPVVAAGQRLGALVLQMPIDRINGVMSHTAGLGRTGETYLVARDLLMRSDSRFGDGSSILSTRVDTEAVRSAFAGDTGAGVIRDYRGKEVLSAWMPLDLLGLDYALVAEMDAEEAFAPVERLFRWLLGLTAILGVCALVVAFLLGRSLTRPVGRITNRIESFAQELLSESQEQQAGAAEQSAAVEETRQTFRGLLDAGRSMQRVGGDVLGHAEVNQQSASTIGTRIEDLSRSTATITDILELVKDIANKSEILALNAALEGTKAGEAGRGFSLVAQQMQRLAEQVMDSVRRIEGLTGEISRSSAGAVVAAEEAGKVSRLTTEAAREITGAVGIQLSSAEQVSVAMDEIGKVASRNVEAARSVVTASNDLLALAATLRQTVGVGD